MICLLTFEDARHKKLDNYRFFFPNHPLYSRKHVKEPLVLSLNDSPFEIEDVLRGAKIGHRGQRFFEMLSLTIGLQSEVVFGERHIGIGVDEPWFWEMTMLRIHRALFEIYGFDEVYFLENQRPPRCSISRPS